MQLPACVDMLTASGAHVDDYELLTETLYRRGVDRRYGSIGLILVATVSKELVGKAIEVRFTNRRQRHSTQVRLVVRGSIAEQSGVIRVGDRVLAIGGRLLYPSCVDVLEARQLLRDTDDSVHIVVARSRLAAHRPPLEKSASLGGEFDK